MNNVENATNGGLFFLMIWTTVKLKLKELNTIVNKCINTTMACITKLIKKNNVAMESQAKFRLIWK